MGIEGDRKSYPEKLPEGIEITASLTPEYRKTLTPEALLFVASLERQFRGTRDSLLAKRAERQKHIDAGVLPTFLSETVHIRESDWKVAPIPQDLLDRRVEITGPVERKMIINALNSGARVFMADFEDALSPSWDNVVGGQINLRDAVDETIEYISPEGKVYRPSEKTAVLMVRPRGWHLDEKHILIDARPATAALVDFGLYFFHNADRLIGKEKGVYFYLPKLQSHLEARLWNEVFTEAQKKMNVPHGTIRATVLIEHILAAFEMDEILYELKDHSAGLNCGRWDYIFSFIKTFRNHPNFVLPDRSLVTMTTDFMKAYVDLLIQTCHRRGIHAMGGMAAQIPVKDPTANEEAMAKVAADKWREVRAGHDGTWVAHPGLIPLATEIFDEEMPTPNQIHVRREEVKVTSNDLLNVPRGTITEKGLRTNVGVGLLYLMSWIRNSGCVPINNLMEDTATAEICRTQIWQWIRHGARLDDGRRVDQKLFRQILSQEVDNIKSEGEEPAKLEGVAILLESLVTSEDFVEFLTIPAYELL